MTATQTFEEWRLSALTLGGEHRLRCHHLPGHVVVVVPTLTLARCERCGRRLVARYAWADAATRTAPLCAPCHNAEHGWPG